MRPQKILHSVIRSYQADRSKGCPQRIICVQVQIDRKRLYNEGGKNVYIKNVVPNCLLANVHKTHRILLFNNVYFFVEV